MRRDTLQGRIDALLPHADLYKPDGPGPFPLVVQLHGCGGKKPFQKTWAEVARDAGAAALVIDSHAPRGISQHDAYLTVCTGLRLRGAERAGDLYAALEWARRQDWVDKTRLCAGGWSHGSWTIMDALCLGHDARHVTGLADLPDDPLAGLRSVFLVYPYAGPGALTRSRRWVALPDVTAIVCGRDYVVGMDGPLRALGRVRAQGARVRLETFPHATHAFDEPDARDLRVKYDPALTARGHHLYAEMLRALSAS
jgi:dienelactone hydrolase